ncbi:hypothetical protein IAE37_004940 [Pseudomonas sp. S31]|uniref:hypothetical protein n=1 Tax=Pseudomonas sp. S31 TaxID=1564473 RepID=UPI001914A284|nr:hypothetical protein [Pseudomonas sp. S31]MBK5002664.1 hypothetical protein [Pseudomonas sp. S31]
MAEQKTGAAKHSADYRAREKAKAEKLGIEDITITMPGGIKKALTAELKRHGYKQVQELWQDLALSWIAQDPEERARRLERPGAPAFYISPKLARQFEAASRADLRRDPGDEISYPD